MTYRQPTFTQPHTKQAQGYGRIRPTGTPALPHTKETPVLLPTQDPAPSPAPKINDED